MKKEYDFTNAALGKFYRPIKELDIPICLDKKIKNFIKEHSSLFWYTPEDKKKDIDEDLLLETILNYGSLENSLQLINIMGEEYVLNKLANIKGRKKNNYYPEIYNFFMLYLKNHVQRNS